jgi:hypothetical protein
MEQTPLKISNFHQHEFNGTPPSSHKLSAGQPDAASRNEVERAVFGWDQLAQRAPAHHFEFAHQQPFHCTASPIRLDMRYA